MFIVVFINFWHFFRQCEEMHTVVVEFLVKQFTPICDKLYEPCVISESLPYHIPFHWSQSMEIFQEQDGGYRTDGSNP